MLDIISPIKDAVAFAEVQDSSTSEATESITRFKIQGEKNVYIMRPCMIHSPGNKGNLNLLYGVVKKGIPWPLSAFENKRTFTSIDNLCLKIKD